MMSADTEWMKWPALAVREDRPDPPEWWQSYQSRIPSGEAPHWEVWQGVNRLYYARRRLSSPAVVVERRESPEDLYDGIMAELRSRDLLD